MNKVTKWINKQISMFVLATANVEKDMLSQKEPNAEDVSHTLNVNQDTLADDLERGIVSQAVQELRWRMYETINRVQDFKSFISHYIQDEEGNDVPVYKTQEITSEDRKRALNKVKLDEIDTYPLEFVIDNSPLTLSSKDIPDMDIEGEVIKTINKEGDEITIHGNIKNEDLNLKQERPIKLLRESLGKFNIADYAKRLHVRNINEDEKLLEFIFDSYPDIYDKKSTLFISELKRILINPRSTNILDITDVAFITYKAIGVKDFLEYHYKIINFDKIIELNGNYIIKFKAKPIINGISVIEKYDGGELEKKYKNKEARKTNI